MFFQEFLAALDPVTKDKILVNLLSMGRGSLDFAKKIASAEPEEPEPPAEDTPEYVNAEYAGQCLMTRKISVVKVWLASPAIQLLQTSV